MSAANQTPRSASPLSQRMARVRALTQGEILVDDEGRMRLVQAAASCLLEPQVGDLVLIIAPEDDPGGYILAVLERPQAGAAPAILSAPGGGDLAIRAPAGRVRVEASEGLELRTPAALELHADETRLQSRSVKLFIDECAAVIRSAFASLTKLTHVGEVFELLVSRFTQHSDHSTRVIAGIDHTQAEEVDLRAGNNVHVRSERTVVNGREVVKLDGGQIHLG
ncbi:MAG: DUF3540 domain-containing protein [Enhygromyxa sp.]